MNLIFRKPDKKYKEEYLKFANKLEMKWKNPLYLGIDDINKQFDKFVDILKQIENEKTLKKTNREDLLRTDTFWLIDQDEEIDEVVASTQFRYPLSDFMEKTYGHINYVVNPNYRNRGYAQFCLEHCLNWAREKYQLEYVIVSCEDRNIGSKKVIESFGGQLLDQQLLPNSITRDMVLSNRYKISTEKRKYKLIDTHTHPFKEYYENPEQEVKDSFEYGLDKMFFVGTNWNELEEVKFLTKKYQNLFPIVGIHPNVTEANRNYFKLEEYIDETTIAIGEIGLDYFYDDTPNKEIQMRALIQQIEVAQKHNLPVMLHIRDAYQDAYDLIKQEKYKNTNFIFHTYAGNLEWAKKYLELGNCYFSFSGVITYKKNIESRKVIAFLPLERIFTETDAPYLSPEPFRGQTNHSAYVEYTLETIAKVKGVSKTKMANIINENVKKVFKV